MPSAARLSQFTHAAAAVPLVDFGYGYNGLGNITQIAELAQTRNFVYDDLQRLTAGGTVATPESYTYDEEGTRSNLCWKLRGVSDVLVRFDQLKMSLETLSRMSALGGEADEISSKPDIGQRVSPVG